MCEAGDDLVDIDGTLIQAINTTILSREAFESLFNVIRELRAPKTWAGESLYNAALGGLYAVEHQLDSIQDHLNEIRNKLAADEGQGEAKP
jgi:hypothetical protein